MVLQKVTKGDTGPQGSKGDKGDTGAQGPKGDQGDTGPQGPKGDKGNTGAQGRKGDQGDTGPQGSKGDKGNTGTQGSKGDKGDTGPQGPKGDKGNTGPKGDTGNQGPPGSGGLSDTGFTMQGNINMDNNKITNKIILVNIDMNGHRITGLPIIPLTSGEPITKGFVERYYSDYTNIMTFKGKPGNVTILRQDNMVDSPANGRATKTLDFSKVGSSYQINFSVQPKLPNGVYTYEMDVVLTTSRGYDVMLWGDCGGSGYNASSKYKYWSWSYENKIAHNDVQGGLFHRGTGKRVRIQGSFLNQGTRIYGQEISLSLDYENGKTYEFVMQDLVSRSTDHVLGNSIYFVFQPDGNHTMDFTDETFFSFKRLLKL